MNRKESIPEITPLPENTEKVPVKQILHNFCINNFIGYICHIILSHINFVLQYVSNYLIGCRS